MVMVRPWKLLEQTMISAWSGSTPLRSYPHLRATLMAVSTASAPVFIGSTASCRDSRARSAQKRPSWSLWNARLVRVSRWSWASAASIRAGWRWPKFSAE